jgi:predicted site-specific integrase-resolvase
MSVHLLETSDVARVLGVTPEAVRSWARSGRLRPWVTTSRGGRLFTPREVERLRRCREALVAKRSTVSPATERTDTPDWQPTVGRRAFVRRT